MKLIEVEKLFPVGTYRLTFACSKCGVQYNRGSNGFGALGRDAYTLSLFDRSKYCMFCGHKWSQSGIRELIDICQLLDITREDVNDEQLVQCLKIFKYLPKNYTKKPNFTHIQICPGIVGYATSNIWITDKSRE